MASHCLTQFAPSPGYADLADQCAVLTDDAAEQHAVRSSIMQEVMVRRPGARSKRSWMSPPIESEKPPKAPKPTPAEREAQIAATAATAAAAAAAPSTNNNKAAAAAAAAATSTSLTAPSTPDSVAPTRAESLSTCKQRFLSEGGIGFEKFRWPQSKFLAKSRSSQGGAGSAAAPAPEHGASVGSDPTSFDPRSSVQASEALGKAAERRSTEEWDAEKFDFSDSADDSPFDFDKWCQDTCKASDPDEAAQPELPALCDGMDDDDDKMFRELFGSDLEDVEDDAEVRQAGENKDNAKGKGKGKAKGDGKGKAKAKAKAEGKGRAKAKAKVRGPKVGGDAVQGPEQVQGPEVGGAAVQGPRQVQGPGVGGAKAKPKAKAKDKGTFAGRRCPADANKKKEFDELKAHYLQARLDAVSTKEEPSGTKTSTKGKKQRKFTEKQSQYWAVMKKRMKELAEEGVPGPERMRIAAAEWKASLQQTE